MVENVQIINKNGDGMFTEGICYVEILSTGKKYLFYTLNERVDNDLIKLYIAESSPVQGEAKPIEQDAWDDLKKKMVKISHKEEVSDIKFINMKDEIFNVSEAKKLAVTSVAKQAFKDAQIINTMSTDVSDESAMPKDVSFYNENVVGTKVENQNNTDSSTSIFTNPPQPEETPVQQILVEESAKPGEFVNNGIDNAFIQKPVQDTIQQNIPEANVDLDNKNVVNNEQEEKMITDDEALKAIDIIQAFIDQEGDDL